jgi:pimeloyl-ACP methyl ester carboxylesterase
MLSIRMTDQPQRWAFVPAAAMAVTGLGLLILAPGDGALTAAGWAWPPILLALAIWMGVRVRRSLGARSGRWALYPVVVVMAAASVGGAVETIALASDQHSYAMPGQSYDVGGYRLHLNCTGTGSPTVVLLNGLGETSRLWTRVQPAVATTARVCAYDRAGQGWSDDSSNPADATTAATDLHKLLTAAGEAGPFVLAGHSSGGVHALTYTHLYPNDVAGVVLLDSASPHQVELMPSFTGEYNVMRRVAAVAPTIARTGIWHAATSAFTPTLPGDAGRQAARFAVSPRGLRNMRAEQAVLPTSFRQAQALTTLGSTPLVVLTAQGTVEKTVGWGTAQNQLAALSTNTRHVVAHLGHVALLDDPDGAALSELAIADVVTAARTGEPLARH